MKKAFPLLLALLILIGSVGCLIRRTHITDSPETTACSTAYLPGNEYTTTPAAVTESADSALTAHTAEKESAETSESEVSTQNETTPLQLAGSTHPTVPTPAQSTPSSEKTSPPQTEPPRQTEPPKETEPPAQTEPPETTPATQPEEQPADPVETEPEPTVPPETEPQETEPPEPEFDIDYWISYSKNYAVSAGLRLEPTAVDCWDNPIRAGNHCTCLERDIQSRLNRYAKDEDIADVWIWAEDRGDGTYDLYIGYA